MGFQSTDGVLVARPVAERARLLAAGPALVAELIRLLTPIQGTEVRK